MKQVSKPSTSLLAYFGGIRGTQVISTPFEPYSIEQLKMQEVSYSAGVYSCLARPQIKH